LGAINRINFYSYVLNNPFRYVDPDGNLYFLYNMLFLQILKKHWGIKVNFDKAYDEANYFRNDKKAWLRSGKHYL